MTKFQIGEIDRLLHGERFIRIHKSYMVNSEKITAYNASGDRDRGNVPPWAGPIRKW